MLARSFPNDACRLALARAVSRPLETLARRIEADGPLPTRDAIRLVARLARTVEGLHGAGVLHGRLSALAVLIPGKRLASARLMRPVAATEAPLMRAPERGLEGDPSSADDAFAIALLLYLALTGQEASAIKKQRRPLAVFDAGDDALQQLLDTSLDKDPHARLRNLRAFREELDAWLEDEGADTDDALPWDEDNIVDDKPLDLSTLPPPPRAELSRRAVAPPKRLVPPPLPKLHTVLDEESTLPKDSDDAGVDDEDSRATIPANVEDVEALAKQRAAQKRSQAGPRLVPPKIVSEKKRRKRASAADDDPPGDDVPPFRSPETPTSEAPPPPSESRIPSFWIIGGVAALGVGAYLLTRSPPLGDSEIVAPANGPTSEPGPAIATSVATNAEPPPDQSSSKTTSSASPLPTESALALPAPEPLSPEDRCTRAALPPDTFESGWVDLGFVCGEADVVKGARRLREAIVLGGSNRAVTNGMKEWALLGFFELPTYAVVRDRCCPKAGPPVVPASPAICKPTMDDAVFAVMQAARQGEVPTDVLAKVDKAARCIHRAKQATSFGQHPKPSGGEGTALRTITNRITKFLNSR